MAKENILKAHQSITKMFFDNISSSDLYINVLGRKYNHKDKQRQTISSMVYILVQLYDPLKADFSSTMRGKLSTDEEGRVMPELKTKLKEYRAKLDMKQGDLAEKVGVRRETIIRLEKGQYNPSLKLAMDIAKVFGVSVEDIFSFEDE